MQDAPDLVKVVLRFIWVSRDRGEDVETGIDGVKVQKIPGVETSEAADKGADIKVKKEEEACHVSGSCG